MRFNMATLIKILLHWLKCLKAQKDHYEEEFENFYTKTQYIVNSLKHKNARFVCSIKQAPLFNI